MTLVISVVGSFYVNGCEYTEKTVEKKLSLFEAHECAQQFRSALSICQALGNCPTNLLFAQAAHNAYHCRRSLNDQVKALEDNLDSYPLHEKNKIFDHQIALSELLATKEAREVLSCFPIDNSKKACMPPFSH